MQREVRERGRLITKVDEVDKSGMFDLIFSSPTCFFTPPPLCSKEKVTQKQHLKTKYTYGLIEAIFSIGESK